MNLSPCCQMALAAEPIYIDKPRQRIGSVACCPKCAKLHGNPRMEFKAGGWEGWSGSTYALLLAEAVKRPGMPLIVEMRASGLVPIGLPKQTEIEDDGVPF